MGFLTHLFTVVVLLAFIDVAANPDSNHDKDKSTTVSRHQGIFTVAAPFSVSGYSGDSGNQRELLSAKTRFTKVSGLGSKIDKLSGQDLQDTTTTSPNTITFTSKDHMYAGHTGTMQTKDSVEGSSGKDALYLCDEMVDFVRHYDLCNTSKLLPQESCKDRCGEKLGIVDSGRFCSCDDLCVVYNDCCLDFSDQCSRLARESEDFFKAEQMHVKLVGCDEKVQYKIIVACHGASKDFGIAWNSGLPVTSSTTYAPTSSMPTYTPYQYTDIANSHLSYFYEKYYRYVEDVSAKVVFGGSGIHTCSRDPEKHSYHRIPYTFLIKDDIADDQFIQKTVFPDNPYDQPSPYVDTPDNKIRGCFLDKTVDCGECQFPMKIFFLTHVCKALKSENRIQYRELLDTNVIYENQQEEPIIHRGSCKLRPSSRRVNKNLFDHRLVTTTNGHDGIVPQQGSLVTIQPVSWSWEQYTVEFSKAPWKRLRCSDLDTVLDDCEIEECGNDYCLTEDRKCQKIIRDRFAVRLSGLQYDSEVITPRIFPRCTCFRILLALKPYFTLWQNDRPKNSEDICLIFAKPFLLYFLQPSDSVSLRDNVYPNSSLASNCRSIFKTKVLANGNSSLSMNVKNGFDIAQQEDDEKNNNYRARLYYKNFENNATDILTYDELREKIRVAISGSWMSCNDSYMEMDICISSSSTTSSVTDTCFFFTYQDINDENKEENLAPVTVSLSNQAFVGYNVVNFDMSFFVICYILIKTFV